MMFFLFVFFFHVGCSCIGAMWGQSGKDWKNSNHADFSGTKDNWLHVFPNDTEFRSKFMFDTKSNELYFFAGFPDGWYLVGLNPDTGDILHKILLPDTNVEYWEFSDANPVMDGDGIVWYLSPWNDPIFNGTRGSVLVGIGPDFQSQQNVTGFCDTGNLVINNCILIYTAESYDPFLERSIDLVAIDTEKLPKKYAWVIRNAFDDNDIMSHLAVSDDGFLYIKNETNSRQSYSSFSKIDITNGKIVKQEDFILREMDTKGVITKSLSPNRFCFSSHTPDYESNSNKENRYISCLNSDTLETIFDIPLEPTLYDVKEPNWAENNPSLSLDEKEIYLKTGYWNGDFSFTSFLVISSDNGEIITKYDLKSECLTGEVPFAVFSEDSKYRFAIYCGIGDDAFLYVMDKSGNVKSMRIDNISNGIGQDLHTIVDDNDCVYYCWYITYTGYHWSKREMKCARTCF